jgi:hypothetical protein
VSSVTEAFIAAVGFLLMPVFFGRCFQKICVFLYLARVVLIYDPVC